MEKIILIALFFVALFLWGVSKNVQPDLTSDGGYEPCKTQGHPLYQDC